MTTNATSGQETSESVDEQRARRERFTMTVLDGAGGGYVNVRNDSHGDEAGAHIYSVEVENGAATGCSCPHAVHRGAHCKHQVAVEDRPLVVSSATAAASTPRVATDGGELVDDTDDDSGSGREQPTRSEPADFGGGEASGMDDLGDPAETVDDGETDEADPCAECGEDMTGRFLAPADPDGDVCVSCAADLDGEDADTEADTDGERGTVDVHGCSTCSGFAQGDNDQCAECRQRGVAPIDDTPL